MPNTTFAQAACQNAEQTTPTTSTLAEVETPAALTPTATTTPFL